jgi:hypothetical protein
MLSISHYKKAMFFIAHFLMTIFVTFVTLYVIGGPGRVYNLNHRRPQFVELDGSQAGPGIKAYRPLQSDITTLLSFFASVTRAAAACWAGKLLWRYAFMLMEKGEITIAGFSKVVDGGITTLLWPRDVANRKNVFLAYLIIFTCFGMDYFSPILTGSVTWQSSFIMVRGSAPLTYIPQGIAGLDISLYRNSSVFGPTTAIEGGGSFESVSYGNLKTDSLNHPITFSTMRRPIIQSEGFTTIQYVPIGSTLDSIRLPYFRVDGFEYILDPNATLTSQQKLLLNDSSVYNPFNNDKGESAFIPDTYWGPGSDPNLPDPVIVTESRIVAIQVIIEDTTFCNTSFPDIPSNVKFYRTLTTNSTGYSCFAFANMTYTAGAVIYQDGVIVSPAVVEGIVENLQPIPDPLTIEALAITPAVGAYYSLIGSYTFELSSAISRAVLESPPANLEPTLVPSLESYTIGYVSQAYQSAWSYLMVELGRLGPENQTNVVFAIPASQPTIFRWRVYFWAGLHLGVLLCGITFAYWHSYYRHPWFSNPAMIAFQLDTAGIFKEGRVANPKDPWDPTAEYPAGKLQLQDYNHERPGQPRAVTLIQEDTDKLGDVSEK